ncbi:hypothetical protein F0562_001803 [Nyssa sinensis]|uniref:Uncharacterized protein n=1 Tax=Nyssa sinensis TaxID=561372 RepID=A0A5J5C4P7_9ASTE|nr:hypothetical protein F0562_001803 [Nyssa sinensis]
MCGCYDFVGSSVSATSISDFGSTRFGWLIFEPEQVLFVAALSPPRFRMSQLLKMSKWMNAQKGRNWRMAVGIDSEVLKANSSVAVNLIADYRRIQVIAVKK